MKTKLKLIGAALVALALLPAAVLLFHVHPATLLGLSMVVGITITYESFQHTGAFGGGFTGGSSTAPTQAQSAQTSLVTATVAFTDTDTVFTLTHNFNLSTAQVAALLPLVSINIISGVQAVGTAVAPVIAVTVAANTVTFTKLQATGSGCTISVAIRRPHSLGF